MEAFISIDDPILKRYLSDDTVIQKVNSLFITLQREEVKKNNEHLQETIYNFIEKMKIANSLFGKTYQRMFFGGSFYKKTKISNPREFDLNIIIKLPFHEMTVNMYEGAPGFIKLCLRNGFNSSNYTQAEQKILNDLVTCDGFLNQERFRAWIEQTITKAIALLPARNTEYFTVYNRCCEISKVRKSGPAFTLALKVHDHITIYVDLVPVLEFSRDFPWHITKRRLATYVSEIRKWLAVPKPLSPTEYGRSTDLYWRLSFYDEEKRILTKNGRVKLLIRLIKKLRDTQGWHGLKSYYIETLFLHQIETMEDEIDRKPLTLLFFMMLHKLRIAFENREICFYWNPRCNLLKNMKEAEMAQMKNRLSRIIKNIERKIAYDKYIIASYILNTDEYCSLMLQEQATLNPEAADEGNVEEKWNCQIS